MGSALAMADMGDGMGFYFFFFEAGDGVAAGIKTKKEERLSATAAAAAQVVYAPRAHSPTSLQHAAPLTLIVAYRYI